MYLEIISILSHISDPSEDFSKRLGLWRAS